MTLPIAFLFVLLACGTEASYCAPRQNFVQIAYIAQGMTGKAHLCGCDTDHDGLEELLFCGHGNVWLYEHIGNNQYELVLGLPDRGSWAAGDIDDDSLSDIVVQTTDSLEIFESLAPDSHPNHCVWQWEVPYVGNAAATWITDLDQDGRKEMLISHMGSFIYVFENTGDNSYTEVFQDTVPSAISRVATGDFDSDGKLEFVTSNSEGSVFVYENIVVGVDSFAITWTGNVPTRTAYAVAAANDMDQDGKPEFVIGGSHPAGGGRRHVFTVFEAIGNDNYESVWLDSSLTSGLLDLNCVACGDVDGDSIDEMLFSVDEEGIFLYKCTGPDSYERIWEWHTIYGIGAVLIYDLNQNGYGELVVSTPGGTWIFEKEGEGVEGPKPQLSVTTFQLLQNQPNPFSQVTNIRYQLADGTFPVHIALRVYDLSGRLIRTLVDEHKQAGYYSVCWDGKNEIGREVSAGVYFYRLEAADFTATKKTVVLR